MLCAIVSENKKIIPTLVSEVERAGMAYILFYNSIVALSHLNLYRPDCFVIDSSAFSFISFQSFVDRFQLYDSSLSSLLILTEEKGNVPVPIRRSNILTSPDLLCSALRKISNKPMKRQAYLEGEYTNTSAFFFSGGVEEVVSRIFRTVEESLKL